MSPIKLGTLMASLSFVTACHFPISFSVTSRSIDYYRAAIESWKGAHMDELHSAWGPAQRRVDLGDGSAMRTYNWSETYTVPADIYYDYETNKWIEANPARTETYYCQTKVLTDPQGIITSIRQGTGFESRGCGDMLPPPSRPRPAPSGSDN
jgi:hypothetical protein